MTLSPFYVIIVNIEGNLRNSEGKTYILLAPFLLIVYNRPREFQNSSGLFSLVGRCLQTWEEEWEREALKCHGDGAWWLRGFEHQIRQYICFKNKWLLDLSAMVCCSLMPTLNSTGNTRRGLPSLISSGRIWKTSCGNGTCTVKWSLNVGKRTNEQDSTCSAKSEKLNNLILESERARCRVQQICLEMRYSLTDLLQRFDWLIFWREQTAISYCFFCTEPKIHGALSST